MSSGLDHALFGRYCSPRRVLWESYSFKPQLYNIAARHHLFLFSSPPSPKFLFSTTDTEPRWFPRLETLSSTAAEPLLFPSPKGMPATHDLFDALAKTLGDDDGLTHPPSASLSCLVMCGEQYDPATPMTVPPSPNLHSKRPRKRARMDHGDR